MINFFRIIAFLEGISYILLLFIAMPIKYWGGDEQYVKLLGMPHGILFLIYIVMCFFYEKPSLHSCRKLLILIIASIVPFGTFYIDWKYLRNWK